MITTFAFLCFAVFYAWLLWHLYKEVRASGFDTYTPFQKIFIYGCGSSMVISSFGLFCAAAIV